MDVDGNGWSGRFHRLMSTRSLVLKYVFSYSLRMFSDSLDYVDQRSSPNGIKIESNLGSSSSFLSLSLVVRLLKHDVNVVTFQSKWIIAISTTRWHISSEPQKAKEATIRLQKRSENKADNGRRNIGVELIWRTSSSLPPISFSRF